MTESEERFRLYLDSHGFAAEHEPDYQDVLGLPERPPTSPDFLISRDGSRAICEVQQFDPGKVDERMSRGGYMALSDKDVYGRARAAIVDKARQLEAFAETGLPLVIVLCNPLGVFVPLDSSHMIPVLFGNPKWTIPIDTTSGGPAGDGEFLVEDYGAAVSLTNDDSGAHFIRRNTHVSAVAVLHERTNEQDFIDAVMARHPSADDTFDAAAAAAVAGIQEVEQARENGAIPDGAYQWLDVYRLDDADAVPLPSGFLAGPRDTAFGFLDEDGTYGQLSD